MIKLLAQNIATINIFTNNMQAGLQLTFYSISGCYVGINSHDGLV